MIKGPTCSTELTNLLKTLENIRKMQGFQVLPIKFSETSQTQHELFIKEHSVRGESKIRPKGRTLFILNVPPWASKENLKKEFNKIGAVTNVILQEKPSNTDEVFLNENTYFPKKKTPEGFRVGYVVFQKPSHLLKCLNEKGRVLILNRDDSPVMTGVQKWIDNYHQSIPNRSELEKEINLFMKKFDADEKKKMSKDKDNEPDEEGWITVTKKGRNPGFSRKESVTSKIREKDKKSKKKKELLNFYSFQIRESKVKHLAKLREKFAEDKEKIEKMKNARKFKPF